jgi:hypothetical protein
MMWSNTAFAMYMGQLDALAASEFEPVRRLAVMRASAADTDCIESDERTRGSGLLGLAGAALSALASRRPLARS